MGKSELTFHDMLDTLTAFLHPQHYFWSQGNEGRMFIENSFCLESNVCTYIVKLTENNTVLIE